MRVVSNFILILMKQEAHLRLYSVIRFKFICVLLLFIYSFSSIKFVATEKTLFFIFQLYYNRNLAYKINMAFIRNCLLLMQPLNLQDTSQVAILIKGDVIAISWQSVLLLVEETGVPVKNNRPIASLCQTLSHNLVSGTPRLSGIRTHCVSGHRH